MLFKKCPICKRIMKKVWQQWMDIDGNLIKKPVWHCCCGVILYKLPKDVELCKHALADLVITYDKHYAWRNERCGN